MSKHTGKRQPPAALRTVDRVHTPIPATVPCPVCGDLALLIETVVDGIGSVRRDRWQRECVQRLSGAWAYWGHGSRVVVDMGWWRK